jgi:hypothetical protein
VFLNEAWEVWENCVSKKIKMFLDGDCLMLVIAGTALQCVILDEITRKKRCKSEFGSEALAFAVWWQMYECCMNEDDHFITDNIPTCMQQKEWIMRHCWVTDEEGRKEATITSW